MKNVEHYVHLPRQLDYERSVRTIINDREKLYEVAKDNDCKQK